MKQRRSTRRWKRLVICGVLGIATTVCVCWSLALGFLRLGTYRLHAVVQPAEVPGTYYLLSGERPRAGVRVARTGNNAKPIEAIFENGELFKPVGEGTEHTGRIVYAYNATLVRDYLTSPDRAGTALYLGLPFEAMCGSWSWESGWPVATDTISLPRFDWLHSVLRSLAPRGGYSGTDPVHLPIGVRPIGFLLNSLLFAFLWYAPLYGLGDIRRTLRKRRQQCEHCGYSRLGAPTDAPCPECGLQSGDHP